MKDQIAQLELIEAAIKAESGKRAKTQPEHPLLAEAATRTRLTIVSLQRYLAEVEAAKPEAAKK